MTREKLYSSYINELKFFNPELQTQSDADVLKSYEEVSKFRDLTWIDIYSGPECVGFLLIASMEHCPPDADYLIMETYIHPNHRGKGLMYNSIHKQFLKNPGNYGLFILNANIDAHKFWNEVFTGHKDRIVKLETNGQYDNAYCRYYLWSVK